MKSIKQANYDMYGVVSADGGVFFGEDELCSRAIRRIALAVRARLSRRWHRAER